MGIKSPTPVIVVAACLISVSSTEGRLRRAFQSEDELNRVFSAYCNFVTAESWHLLSDVASTVTDPDRDVLLQMALADGPDMQLCSWTLLSALGDTRLVPIVAPVIADSSITADVRNSSCSLIASFATADAVPALLSVLDEPISHDVNAGLQKCAITALGNTDDNQARETVRDLIDSPAYRFARFDVIQALGRLRDHDSVPRLVEIMQDTSESRSFRETAAAALAAIGTPESIASLREFVESLPAGQRRWDLCLKLTSRLANALEEATSAGFREELQNLIDTLLALGNALPVPGQ